MNIGETNNTVETFKKACIDEGYIFKDNDKQIKYLLDRQSGEINFTFEKDGKTITGYKFVSVSE